MKGYFKNMKTITKVDFATYLGVILAFIVVSVCQAQGLVNRSLGGMLVPICCYVCMSISLNLTVGILGELSLGHAGFMSVGAFSGIIAAMSLQSAIPSDALRLAVAMIVGAAVSHNFGLAGAADSVAEDGTYVVGGIGTAGMAAVAIGFAVLLAITVTHLPKTEAVSRD